MSLMSSWADLWQDAGQKGLVEHVVRVNADRYTPVGPDLIPTGDYIHIFNPGFIFVV